MSLSICLPFEKQNAIKAMHIHQGSNPYVRASKLVGATKNHLSTSLSSILNRNEAKKIIETKVGKQPGSTYLRLKPIAIKQVPGITFDEDDMVRYFKSATILLRELD